MRIADNSICLLQEAINGIQGDTFSGFRRISFPQELIEGYSDIHRFNCEVVLKIKDESR
jgi:hypothetical protein